MARSSTSQIKVVFDKTDAVSRAMRFAVEKAIREVGDQVLAEAQALVPVDTGALKASLRVTNVPEGEDAYGVALTTDSEYWMHVEYGTRNMPAQPYIRPAVEWGEALLEDGVAGAVNAAVETTL